MALLVAARALEAYAGTPYETPLRSAFGKILDVLDARAAVTVYAGGALPRFELEPAREVDPALYGRLLLAWQRRARLEITYRTASRNEVNVRRVDPYHLLNHAGDWLLIGFCHLRRRVLDFAVGERMLELRETGERFEPDPAFDLDAYLASGFGLFKGGEEAEVVLKFSPEQARYMRERVWDESETKETLEDGSLLLRLRAPVNEGLRQFVLRYGAAVEVVEPESLRREVAEELGKALDQYGSGPPDERRKKLGPAPRGRPRCPAIETTGGILATAYREGGSGSSPRRLGRQSLRS